MELLYAEMTAVNCNGLGFITQYWPAINITLIVIKAVTVLFAALSGKGDKLTRILKKEVKSRMETEWSYRGESFSSTAIVSNGK